MLHPGLPPVFGLPYPHPLGAGNNDEMMEEKVISDQNIEDHTISPESGNKTS